MKTDINIKWQRLALNTGGDPDNKTTPSEVDETLRQVREGGRGGGRVGWGGGSEVGVGGKCWKRGKEGRRTGGSRANVGKFDFY